METGIEHGLARFQCEASVIPRDVSFPASKCDNNQRVRSTRNLTFYWDFITKAWLSESLAMWLHSGYALHPGDH